MKKYRVLTLMLPLLATLLGYLLISGCQTKKPIVGLQTQIHDIAVEMREYRLQEAAYQSMINDCEIKQVSFGKDSFGFYTQCPNEAKPIRKAVIKQSYKLVNGE